ncbi:hypothetical protein H310_09993 [Aphanomyces invadans]|uniref:DUF5009 domain-containing protein n=1 Tax=Aphanomyces invadans TaxID=157072 RepID=A0A024TSS7_9STRA|nr:hypothetical protein H310_09993 [Aphanomyces invadans]ETV97205.1 hypothetical protein H310_09993 [Aphanomyces invadans]|eukprot:XP_008874451.1 hypothetical protein H310_09993 [Aphanomyces invadans]
MADATAMTSHYTLAIEEVEAPGKAAVDDNILTKRPHSSKKRVVCLDVFRGITIFAMIFVNLGGGGLEPFMHVEWNGLRPADCVFPFFAWIMGVTMNIGMGSHARKGTPSRTILVDSFIRAVKLFLLGLVVNNVRNFKTGRITGVLQSFGFAYFFVTVCIVVGTVVKSNTWPWLCRTVEASIVATSVLANVLITFYLPVPGCPTGYIGNEIEGCEGGAHLYIDMAIFGEEHMYIPGANDPEGFLNWIMVAFITYIGYVMGGYFLQVHETRHKGMVLVGTSLGLALFGLALTNFTVDNGLIPINKQMWSLSYVFTVSGLASLVLALLYGVVDRYALWSGIPFKYNGMNAIALYVGHEVMGNHAPFGWDIDDDSKTERFLSNIGGAIIWTMIAMWMAKKSIFITV